MHATYPTTTENRFRLAIIPALWMGLGTNVYIASILAAFGAYDALWSPGVGNLLFATLLILIKKYKITANTAFFLTAYTVAAEICFHTYLLGWESGFYYFFFLLPVVFFLNTLWKLSTIVLFNFSILSIGVTLLYFFRTAGPGIIVISEEESELLNISNFSGTSLVVFVVMVYFSRTLSKRDAELLEANKALEQQNSEISKQHQQLQMLIKEIHHRVKNNLQIISSLMSLQHRTVLDDRVGSILTESRRRIEAIALIHQKLYQDDKVSSVDFKSYLEDLLNSQRAMNNNVRCTLNCEDVVLHLDVAVPLGLIISELITNSMKHAFEGVENPELSVILRKRDDRYELIVEDNGNGLPAKFSLEDPESLGTEIVVALTDQIDATVSFGNNPGAQFTILFKDLAH